MGYIISRGGISVQDYNYGGSQDLARLAWLQKAFISVGHGLKMTKSSVFSLTGK